MVKPELIRLDKPPSDWKHTVAIDSLATSVDSDRLMQTLQECGGPVYHLTLHQAPDRQFAMAQFFCESHAERFRQNCDKRPLGGQRIDVKRFVRSSSCATPASRTRATRASIVRGRRRPSPQHTARRV